VKRPVDRLLDDIIEAAEVADEFGHQFGFVTDYPVPVGPSTTWARQATRPSPAASIREATLFFRALTV
jgi:hypothetical protein